MYVAIVNVPGYLPDSAEPPPRFATAKEAWWYLAEGLPEEERWTEDNSASPLALQLEAQADRRMADGTLIQHLGTVYGPDGLAYSVEYVGDE